MWSEASWHFTSTLTIDQLHVLVSILASNGAPADNCLSLEECFPLKCEGLWNEVSESTSWPWWRFPPLCLKPNYHYGLYPTCSRPHFGIFDILRFLTYEIKPSCTFCKFFLQSFPKCVMLPALQQYPDDWFLENWLEKTNWKPTIFFVCFFIHLQIEKRSRATSKSPLRKSVSDSDWRVHLFNSFLGLSPLNRHA